MRHLSTLILAAVVGILLTYLGYTNSMAFAHGSLPIALLGLLILPGQMAGVLGAVLPGPWVEVCAWLIQVVYYIAIAVGLKAFFFRFFFERNDQDGL